jgi:hypothetical protein
VLKPLAVAVNVTVVPDCSGADAGSGSIVSGAPVLMVQTKLALATLTPSLAVTRTLKLPCVVGVPDISPVALLIEMPGGKPVAAKIRVSPFGSDAFSWTLTFDPA